MALTDFKVDDYRPRLMYLFFAEVDCSGSGFTIVGDMMVVGRTLVLILTLMTLGWMGSEGRAQADKEESSFA